RLRAFSFPPLVLYILIRGFEHTITGTSLYVVGPDDDVEDNKQAAMGDMKSVMSRIDKSGEGVYVQATTLGSLEALLEFLKTPREEKKKEVAEEAVFPCVLNIVPNCVVNKKDPIVLGVDVLEGIFREKCKKQLMIANSDFMEKMEDKFLNLVSKLEEKDKAITSFMLSAE
ncbi:hypothetical protein MTR67_017759, partial [Solanum verrucosum]